MLAGEGMREYVTRDREHRFVCDLCRIRAEAAGWIPAELAAAPVPEGNHEGRGRGRMRRLWERARESATAISGGSGQPDAPAGVIRDDFSEDPGLNPHGPADGGPEVVDAQEPAYEESPVEAELAPAPPSPPSPPRARRLETGDHPTTRRRRRSIPQSPNRRIKRAFETFNETEYARTIGGLIRSLGPPRVAAVTTAHAPEEVRITVAWELSWYQWEVDLTGDGAGVRELAKGEELGQLSDEDQGWNGYATEEGELRFGAERDDAGE
jgi:hypothetical protein